MKKFIAPLLAASLVLSTGGCTTDPYTGEQKISSTAIGAAAGAVLGAAVSSKKDRKKGALIGAAVGGGVGYYFDHQEKVLREKLQNTGVSVTRTPEGIKLNMPGHISFPTNQYTILPSFYEVLDSVALVFNEFDKTRIKISGHTDSQGADAYNQKLSERRANSVLQYFVGRNVVASRMNAYGYGESIPLVTNDTPEGRAQNRRVEIDILNMQ